MRPDHVSQPVSLYHQLEKVMVCSCKSRKAMPERGCAQQGTRVPSLCHLTTSASRTGCMNDGELTACLSARKNVLPPNNCKIQLSLQFLLKQMMFVLFRHEWLCVCINQRYCYIFVASYEPNSIVSVLVMVPNRVCYFQT
jgi:hypothetical protein